MNIETTEIKNTADILRIMRMIPHRYPFLMIDKVKDIQLDESAVGIKNVTMNEPFFVGHFPDAPVMPGVLIVEAMAQTAAVLVVDSMDLVDKNMLVYFMTIDNCKFRQKVIPGDVVELHVNVLRKRSRIWKFAGVAKIDGKTVAQADFSAMIADPE